MQGAACGAFWVLPGALMLPLMRGAVRFVMPMLRARLPAVVSVAAGFALSLRTLTVAQGINLAFALPAFTLSKAPVVATRR